MCNYRELLSNFAKNSLKIWIVSFQFPITGLNPEEKRRWDSEIGMTMTNSWIRQNPSWLRSWAAGHSIELSLPLGISYDLGLGPWAETQEIYFTIRNTMIMRETGVVNKYDFPKAENVSHDNYNKNRPISTSISPNVSYCVVYCV